MKSETRGGRTTRFGYDGLFRTISVQPPGADATPPMTNATTIAYDNQTGATMTVTRGSSLITTTVDGFGRPISMQNSVGVRTSTRYDGEGRTVFEGYPVQANGAQ